MYCSETKGQKFSKCCLIAFLLTLLCYVFCIQALLLLWIRLYRYRILAHTHRGVDST